MLTFKEYISESRLSKVNVDKFIEWCDKNASESIKGTHLVFRGARRTYNSYDGLYIGNSAGELPRKSVSDIPNFYTWWIDHNEQFDGFPKRSRSFIATDSIEKAKQFGKLYLVILADNCNVGKVNSVDIWDVNVAPDLSLYDFNNFTSRLIRALKLDYPKSYEELKDTLKLIDLEKINEIVNGNYSLKYTLSKILSIMEKHNLKDFYDVWDNFVNVKLFDKTDGAEITHSNINGEIWIEGECAFIPWDINFEEDEIKEKIKSYLIDKNINIARRLFYNDNI